jgi:hypothetical protein
MISVEERAKLRAAAQWMQGDVLYINDPVRLMLLDEIEALSTALGEALVRWKGATGGDPGPRHAELRKLVAP